MIKRLLPAPLLSAALILMWLVLNRSLDWGQLLLAVLFGVAAPALLAPLRPGRVRIRRPLSVAVLVLRVGRDAVASSLEVFWSLLHLRVRPVHNRFVVVPLALRDPAALAALAVITTVVPGTLWCELARDGSSVLLHVWNAPDEAAFIADFKARYEAPLHDIFETA